METSSTPVPAPPRLHWIAAVALTIVTLGLFAPAWMIRQAWWMKRADGDAKALAGLIASITIFAAASIVAEQIGGGSGALRGVPIHRERRPPRRQLARRSGGLAGAAA